MIPGRKNPLFTEDGIRAAILGNLEEIETGQRPAVIYRPRYQPYKKHSKYTGFIALYVHYLYVLGKIGERKYPPRMTPQLKAEVMKFEQHREQFAFLRNNGISTQADIKAFQVRTEETLTTLTKQRTILNVRKKKRKKLYAALTDIEALTQAKQLYEDGISGMEAEYAQYLDAVTVLDSIPREQLASEKADIYQQLSEVNRQIRAERKRLAMCQTILSEIPRMEKEIQQIEHEKEVSRNEHRRR